MCSGGSVVRNCPQARMSARRSRLRHAGLKVERPAIPQKPGKRSALRDGKGRKSKAATGHEARLAAGPFGSPHHGAPDHLGGKCARPERRRKFEIARRSEPKEVGMFDFRASQAEIQESHAVHTAQPRGRRVRQRRARHHTPFGRLCHPKPLPAKRRPEKTAGPIRTNAHTPEHVSTVSPRAYRVKQDPVRGCLLPVLCPMHSFLLSARTHR